MKIERSVHTSLTPPQSERLFNESRDALTELAIDPDHHGQERNKRRDTPSDEQKKREERAALQSYDHHARSVGGLSGATIPSRATKALDLVI